MRKILDNCFFPVCDDPGPDAVGKCLLYAVRYLLRNRPRRVCPGAHDTRVPPHDQLDISQARWRLSSVTLALYFRVHPGMAWAHVTVHRPTEKWDPQLSALSQCQHNLGDSTELGRRGAQLTAGARGKRRPFPAHPLLVLVLV